MLNHYLGGVKSDLEVALSKHDRANRTAGSGKFVKSSTLQLQPGPVLTVYIRSVLTPVAICGDIFPNKDGSLAAHYRCDDDLPTTSDNLPKTVGDRGVS